MIISAFPLQTHAHYTFSVLAIIVLLQCTFHNNFTRLLGLPSCQFHSIWFLHSSYQSLLECQNFRDNVIIISYALQKLWSACQCSNATFSAIANCFCDHKSCKLRSYKHKLSSKPDHTCTRPKFCVIPVPHFYYVHGSTVRYCMVSQTCTMQSYQGFISTLQHSLADWLWGIRMQ